MSPLRCIGLPRRVRCGSSRKSSADARRATAGPSSSATTALVFEGYSGTGDKLFTEERTQLPPLIYHAFVFALDADECEIWVKDDAKTRFERGRSYRAYLNADDTYCWFYGQEALVRHGEADHGAEDGAS